MPRTAAPAWECSWCSDFCPKADRKDGPDGPGTLCLECSRFGGDEEQREAAPAEKAPAAEERAPDSEAAPGGGDSPPASSVSTAVSSSEQPRAQRQRGSPRGSPRTAPRSPRLRPWKCEWCECDDSEGTERGDGPSGPGTLCSACAHSYTGNRAVRPPDLASPRTVATKAEARAQPAQEPEPEPDLEEAAAKATAEPAKKLAFTHHGPKITLTEDGTQDTLTSLSLDPRG